MEETACYTFSELIANCEQHFAKSGKTIELAEPAYGWSFPDDEEAAQDPFPAQLLAAYQIFIHLFLSTPKKIWVHLGAEMQAGKTGAVNALIRLVLKNFRTLNIHPDHIFILTGMSDVAWKKQTQERLIRDVRNGVEHNNGLGRVASEFYKISSRFGKLQNILIIIDESHIAGSKNNRPNSVVIDTIKELCPREMWAKNNINFLTISATDPAKVLDISNSCEDDCTVVRLQTDENYQSVETLYKTGRIIDIEEDIHTDQSIKWIKNIIQHKYNGEPLYHILRPKARITTMSLQNWERNFRKLVLFRGIL